MKNMLSKKIALFIVILFTLNILFTGCTNNKVTTSKVVTYIEEEVTANGDSGGNTLENTANSATNSDIDSTTNSGIDSTTNSVAGSSSYKIKKYNPPITLTTARYVDSKSNVKWEDDEYIKWAKEKLGIIWKPKFTAVDGADAINKLVLLAATNDLPDVMPIVTMGEVYKFGNAGYLADVKNLIQQYGSPLLKYVAIDEYNTMTNNKGYEAATIKGKVVAMPQVLDAYNGGMTFIFRKDILDQLGLNMPKSITDLDKTYAAFKAKYPSKYCIYIKSWPTELPQFWEAFGVSPQPTASYKVNGKYTFGSIQPGAKAGLAKLREWYQKGYINPSYETDYDPHQGIINGKYLSIYEGVWGSGYLYQLAAKTAPSATFAPMGYITGTNGKRGDILQYNYFQWPTMISASSKNKEAIIMEANAVAESMFRNDADLRKKYGNSYPITKLQQASNPQEVAANGTQYAKYKYAYNEIGPGFFNTETRSVGLSNTFTRADNTVNVSSKIYDKFIANNKNFSKTMEILTGREQTVVMGQMKVSQPYSLRALEASTAVYKILGAEVASKHMILSPVNLASINSWQNKYRDTLNLLTMTTYNGIIRGTMAIDDFDKYVQEFKSKGGDEVLKEINQKYK